MPCLHTYQIKTTIQTNNDVLCECTRRPAYLSVSYHRSQGRIGEKNLWSIPVDEEGIRFFCAFDSQNLSSSYDGLWHIESGNNYIGTGSELIAYFKPPENASDPWHGYPFTFARKSNRDKIKALKQVADMLARNGNLTTARAKKIRQGEL